MKRIIVIKCGGSTADELSEDFFKSIKTLKNIGFAPVIVHGGGPDIKKMLEKLNIHSEFVNGLRKTDQQVMEVVEMVLSGKVNKWMVRKIGEAGLDSIGLSGCDGRLIEAVPLDLKRLGFVGDVVNINTELLFSLLDRDNVPVIASVGIGNKGQIYNINADTAAGWIASKTGAEKLVFVTNVQGILKNGKLLEKVTKNEVCRLIEDGTIYGGMIPKVKAAINSLQENLEEVMIIDGKDKAIDLDGNVSGTTIIKNLEVIS